MKSKELLLSFALLSSLTIISYGQEVPKPSINNGTIDDKFEYIFDKSNGFQEYEVVKKAYLNSLRRQVDDTINGYRNQIAKKQLVIAEQKSAVDTLTGKLESIKTELAKVQKTKNSISVLGIETSKGAYNSIMWGLTLALLAALLFFIMQFKRSHLLTREAKAHLAETEDEFAKHKKRAMEKEQKLNRRLQDELNKQNQGRL